MRDRRLIWLIVLLTAAAVFVDLPTKLPRINFWTRPPIDWNVLGGRFFRDLEIKEGLDLAGGTHLTLEADMSRIKSTDRNDALQSLKSIVERRVNAYGVSEPVVQTAKVGNSYRLVVELAGVTDLNQAIDLVGRTAELTFRETVGATESANVSSESAQLYGPFQGLTDLTGKDVAKATPSFDSNTGSPIIQLNFTGEGARKWERITRRNLNKQLAIVLDNRVLLAPTVQAVITDGRTVISGSFTTDETKQRALLINSGALPAPVKVIEESTVGATLGQDSINKSLLAGAVGLLIVALFMIANYRRLGVFADVALVIYSLLVLAIFKLIPVTLTLAGIAGFILSIGMAVDANILIFERMREEVRWGREKAAAIELGFARAFPSIRDSNVSTLLTCAILYWFGTGPVRGFAVTLAIGVIVSLFTAVIVTRTFLRLWRT